MTTTTRPQRRAAARRAVQRQAAHGRATSGRATHGRGPSGATSRNRQSWTIALVMGVVFGALVIAALTTGDPPVIVEVDAVTVAGEPLATYDPAAEEPGATAPTAVGPSLLDDTTVDVPVAGTPTMLVFLAHWCEHCQAEVPVLQAWVNDGGLRDDVALRAVATSIDPARPNYPPEAWLSGEGWTAPTLIDDGSLAQAYGVTSFPFWVFIDGDGVVQGRAIGELDMATVGRAVDALAAPR